MRTLMILLGLCVPLTARGQITFERTYGGPLRDEGFSVEQTDDGGYIIAGLTYCFGARAADVYLIKTDEWGDTLWTRTYGGSDIDAAYSVEQTDDGGYIITGGVEVSLDDVDCWLLKANATGDTTWTRTYGGSGFDLGLSVEQTADGGYIIAGSADPLAIWDTDVYLIKEDEDGDTVWTRVYGGSDNDYGWSIAQTDDGAYIIAGSTSSFGAGASDVWLLKVDALGDTVWTRTYGGSWGDEGRSVEQTDDGGYIIAGCTASFGAGEYDAYLIKTDAEGDTLWTRTYGGPEGESGNWVAQTDDGEYIICGGTGSFGVGGWDVYLVKTQEAGDTVWTRRYGGSGHEEGRCVEQASDGGYIIAGGTRSFGAGSDDVYLIKTDADGLVRAPWVQVTPDTMEIPPGEDMWFTIDIVNATPETLIFDAWVDGYLLNGNPYGGNPVLGPVEITLAGNHGFYGVRKHVHIPQTAPYGSPYELCVCTGEYPDSIWAEDCFEFAIVPPPVE